MPPQNETAQVLVLVRIKQACAAEGSLESLVADVDAYDVPLLCEFEALFVRPLPVAMDQCTALRSSVVEASGAAFHFVVLRSQVGLAAESGDHLVDQGACLTLIRVSAAGRSGGLLSRETR